MRILKVENLVAKSVLSFLVLWGVASFFIFPTVPFFEWAFLVVSLISIYLIFRQQAEYFVLINIIISSTYFFYGIESAFGLSLWLILLGLVLFLGATFWFLGQRLIKSENNFLLILVFFLLSMLEIYLSLSFWLINPLTKSLIIGIFAYLFAGFLENASDDNTINKKFTFYIYTAIFTLLILIFTVSWGR